MDINLFAAVFALIFTAELPDKTAFATFLMATRGKPLAIFTGVAAAFVVQSFIAVIGGSFVGLLRKMGSCRSRASLHRLCCPHMVFP